MKQSSWKGRRIIDRGLSRKQNKLGPRNFWVGFMVMLLFAGIGLLGSAWAIDHILLEKALYNRGVVTSGVVLRKKTAEGILAKILKICAIEELREKVCS